MRERTRGERERERRAEREREREREPRTARRRAHIGHEVENNTYKVYIIIWEALLWSFALKDLL